MNPVRIVILCVAAIAAVGLAFVLRNMASKPKAAPVAAVAPAPAPKPLTRVLVAAGDLAVGARLTAQDLTWQPWPEDALTPSFITDGAPAVMPKTGAAAAASQAETAARDVISGGGPAMQNLVGAIVRDPFEKGEPIVARKLVRPGDGGYMSVVLQPGMRAIALPVNADTGAGGFIQPGDRVDLIESHQDNARRGGPGYVSEVVVSNIRVLAVDQTTEPAKNGKSIVGATITLEIPAPYAQTVTEAKARGGVILALRSYADMAGGPGGAMSATSNSGAGVRMNRGGAVTEVAVSR